MNTNSLSLKKIILSAIAALSILLTWLPWASVKFPSREAKLQYTQLLDTEFSPEMLFGNSYGFIDSALQQTAIYRDTSKALTVTVKAIKDGALSLGEAHTVVSHFNKVMKSADSLSGAMAMLGAGSDLEDSKVLIGIASSVLFLLFWGGLLFGAGAIYSIWTEKFKFTRILFTILRIAALLAFGLAVIVMNEEENLFRVTFWAFLAVLAAFPAGFHNLYLSRLIPEGAAASVPMPEKRFTLPAQPKPVTSVATTPARSVSVTAPDTFRPVADLPASVKWLCRSCGGVNDGTSLHCEYCSAAKPTFLVCPSCHTVSKSGGRFCSSCGGAVPPITSGMVCAACGHENPMGSTFCEECGAKL